MTERDFALYVSSFALKNTRPAVEYLDGLAELKSKEWLFRMRVGLESEHAVFGHVACDRCGCELTIPWDQVALNGWPYQGVQAVRPDVYTYSPAVNLLRALYNVEGQKWPDNPIGNSHARVHTNPPSWDLDAKGGADKVVRTLCNKCFRLTYHRMLVQGDDGVRYAVSVLPEETLKGVMEELNIKGRVIGRGSVKEY